VSALRRESGRFVIAGSINTFVGIFLFPIVDTFGRTLNVHYFVSLVACNVVNWFLAYLLAAYYVFPGSPRSIRSYVLHNALYWFWFIVSLIVIPLFAEFHGVDPRATFLVLAGMSAISGFLWQKYFVFGRKA
jgi:putative flippase GtrA